MKQAPTGHGSNSCSSKWMPSFSFEVPPLQLHLLEYPWSWISSWGPSWDAPLKFLFVLTLSQNKRKKKVRNMHLLQVGNWREKTIIINQRYNDWLPQPAAFSFLWVRCWGWVQDELWKFDGLWIISSSWQNTQNTKNTRSMKILPICATNVFGSDRSPRRGDVVRPSVRDIIQKNSENEF